MAQLRLKLAGLMRCKGVLLEHDSVVGLGYMAREGEGWVVRSCQILMESKTLFISSCVMPI